MTAPDLPNAAVILVQRQAHFVLAYIVQPQGPSQTLPHIQRHSEGFNYGYEGSGPADLALSILAACVGQEKADRWYQDFKRDRLAPETSDRWTIKVAQVREYVKQQEAAQVSPAPPFWDPW